MSSDPATEKDEARLHLRAGPLAMVFDADTAFLRRIRGGGREVVRGIYAAVRDHEWNTVPARVTLVEKHVADAYFRLIFDVAARNDRTDFRWRGTITGDPAGSVQYSLKGRAHASFRRNRIGFCVLHPVDGFAGTVCTVEHTDGSTEDVFIPEAISPDQPVYDIRGLTQQLDAHARLEVKLEGDVFEMEDQRNWTDASFKTYCTPLERPFPVRIEKGDTVEQSVTIRLHGRVRDAPAPGTDAPGVYASRGPVRLQVDETASGTAPEVGAAYSGADAHETLPLNHLRVDVDASDPALDDALADAAAAARRHSSSLFVAALVDGRNDVLRLASAASEIGVPVSRWLLLRRDGRPTSSDDVQAARTVPAASVGGGTAANFTEFNRVRPQAERLDFVCFSVNPQAHAFDELSMMETLPVHAAVVENARRIARGSPVVVSPITLRPRFNHEASTASAAGTGYDPRQDQPFGAAWTAGSYVYLSRAAAAAVTYFDVGTVDEPVTGLLLRISSMRDRPTYRVRSSDEDRVVALGLGPAPRSVLIANLTPFEQKASMDGVSIGPAAPEVDVALGKTVTLPPYGWTILEETA